MCLTQHGDYTLTITMLYYFAAVTLSSRISLCTLCSREGLGTVFITQPIGQELYRQAYIGLHRCKEVSQRGICLG
jgi:hypothetical protein